MPTIRMSPHGEPSDYGRRAAAEFLGTFALVFVGAGALVYARTLTDIGLAYGLIVGVMTISLAAISGANFNPAITLGLLVTRRISVPGAVVHWVAQLVGAIAAAALLRWVLPTGARDTIHLGAPSLGEQVSAGHAVVVEAVLTFFVVWVYFAAIADPRGALTRLGGLAVGLAVTAGVLVAGALTGAALNPARAFGPQLIDTHWGDAWVWYLGPFAGGAVAAVLYELLFARAARPAAEVAAPAAGDPPLA